MSFTLLLSHLKQRVQKADLKVSTSRFERQNGQYSKTCVGLYKIVGLQLGSDGSGFLKPNPTRVDVYGTRHDPTQILNPTRPDF